MEHKILITGAAGFIGSHLVECLLASGQSPSSVRLLVLPSDNLENLPPKPFTIIRADIRDKRAVSKAVEGVSVIYHLAARTMDGKSSVGDYQEINVRGTKNLTDACHGEKIQKLVFFSSIAVFGLPAWRGDMVKISESSPKQPSEPYGESKLEAEKCLQRAHRQWGLPYAIIRPTTVYGPRDRRNLFELYQAIKKHYFFFIGDGRNKMDYVFVRDLVEGALLAQRSDSRAEDYILSGDGPLTLQEIVTRVAESIGEPAPNIYIPRWLGLALSYVTHVGGKAFGLRSPLFPSRVRVLTANCFFSIAKARRLLGYQPKTSFAEGARLTAIWLREKGLL